MSKLKSLINPEYIKESPDKVLIDDEETEMSWNHHGTYAFGIINGIMYVDRGTHYDMLEYISEKGLDLDGAEKMTWDIWSKNGNVIKARDVFQYPGRIWVKHKVLSFWKYPSA